MIVESHHLDALPHWQNIVQLIKESTVVFNMIDVGEYFDAAIQSACMKNKTLLIQGGTFCQTFSVDIYKPGQPCVACQSLYQWDMEVIDKLLPSKIEAITDLSFIPRDRNPIQQSNSYVCTMCANMIVARFSTLVIDDPEVEVHQRFIMTVNSGEVVQFPVEKEPECPFCKDLTNETQ